MLLFSILTKKMARVDWLGGKLGGFDSWEGRWDGETAGRNGGRKRNQLGGMVVETEKYGRNAGRSQWEDVGRMAKLGRFLE